jgi:hypothetical protein
MFKDGSITTEGMFCLVVASSPAVWSSTPCFECLGSEAFTLEKLAQEEFMKGTFNG